MEKIIVHGSLNRTNSREHNIPIANIVMWSESRFGAFSCEILLSNGDIVFSQTPINIIEKRIKEAENGK